ncbi:MAG: hypothetical protein UX77_C0005G0011 [Parcubacteria group bacterium GW2011_GWA1_47_11]|uniref:HIT domain-containing protein n=1 Tax=Candidatus Colwellbacteria bacterium GWA2_46_10 TaxID=1797684 RepID=A0A1G1YWI7_9BACT|nr:MAG: hypothetical protein UX29_C0009G0022 [Parcubacteria group bacterium GW2011_GWA2_46_10]KKU55982.1 MAG: hypothetical protein UX77_C0005G0011 [Parcubacteria group bacterium GW2011_GWA1_47_11]OGY56126.1 MAG: hypothetical protein A2119_02870 [Candidatus Colwellbacteria bacterium GWA2_46_10]
MSAIEECPFCHADERKIKENDLAFVILSNPRKMKGHFLVVPKRHVEKPWELIDREVKAIFSLVFFVQKKVSEKLSVGCDVRQNYRPFLKQGRVKVDHVHYHIMPRDFEDELYTKIEYKEAEMFAELTPEERGEMEKVLS